MEKNSLGLGKRLATKKEVKEIFEFLTGKILNNQLLFANSFGLNAEEQEIEAFLKNSIGSFMLVDEFLQFEAFIFTYSITHFNSDINNTCNSYSGRVLKIKNEFKELSEDDMSVSFLIH